ncbi:bifunctional phosphoribosylaminoimidazolecarboxamide formyltransferase/IMP cyclohydrolase [Puniceicoccales bacterium CK1056]|uniref:Bifunctional purine biosynthesis protein PurH n=1 Tax=Oceanipulchritudo coccoides TaxID=2706888 RepID=A0A6B2M5M5_9BACT|nr:bifunctional phosphoribosylaminoimidazolecarboxamide formyltransferase/IMP cyclohydrolase [Oceanipulchritudo coccoides]
MTKTALISVSDKTGIVPFAKELVTRHGFRILSTGGTAKAIAEAGIEVIEVGDYTGFPEMMEGRVKTLHPKIHGGLLCLREKSEHMEQAAAHDIEMIDMVVVNLYPFEETVAKDGVTREEAIEQIDIGGPSMLRSAAKNHASVTVITDPADYSRVLAVLDEPGELAALRRELAIKVYARTSEYDGAITKFLSQAGTDEPDLSAISGLPDTFSIEAEKASSLRYGENPHQQAALYGRFFEVFEQLQGKELSFNNIIDISAATYLIGEFESPTVAILKHTNPCGVASADSLVEAWDQAFATDRQAPFGGIIVVNQTVDGELAQRIREIFCEVIIAPHFSDDALEQFGKRKNLRLMINREGVRTDSLQDIRSAIGGFLVQDRDQKRLRPAECKVVTERQPTEAEWAAMLFGWKVVKHVKSNAIVYAAAERTLGIGAGQMSRVDSSRIAVWKAGEAKLPLAGSIIASDAFFPFADGLEAAADAGATAAIQPGGSVRDEEVIAAANKRGMAMVFTGIRHFRH